MRKQDLASNLHDVVYLTAPPKLTSTGRKADDESSALMSVSFRTPVRIAEQAWPPDTTPLVSVCCITYNHERFIRDAIEGFLMQETTFLVEILIHDDASTDETSRIIRDYERRFPHLIKPVYQTENQYSRGIKPGANTLSRSKGEFIAMCDGDDAWTDATKLQRQVDFLRTHSDYAGSCHAALHQRVDQQGCITEESINGFDATPITLKDMIDTNPITTCSVVCRRDSLVASLPAEFNSLRFADLPRWFFAAMRGPFAFDSRVMSTYRKHSGGVWTRLSTSMAEAALANYGLVIAKYVDGTYKTLALTASAQHFGSSVFHACLAGDEQFIDGLVTSLKKFPWEENEKAYPAFIERIGDLLAKGGCDSVVALQDSVNELLARIATDTRATKQFHRATDYLQSYVSKRFGDYAVDRREFREARRHYVQAVASGRGQLRARAVLLALSTHGGDFGRLIRKWVMSVTSIVLPSG